MKAIGIIPARYASTRFPGKPLVMINGKTMIQRVYEQVCLSESISEVIVATDDNRITEHVKSFGGKVILTSESHRSGTDRCNEVAGILNLEDQNTVIINIQGDEPFINPAQIDDLAKCFNEPATQIATLKKRIINTDDIFDENVVKVVTNLNNEALYFSRSAIPFARGRNHDVWFENKIHFKHIGIYAYRKFILNQISGLPISNLEISESLEQLRWLENGFKITVKETGFESVSIDTPDDLKKITELIFYKKK